MKRSIPLFALIFMLSAVFLTANVFAQYAPQIQVVKGTPKILKKDTSSWSDCKVRMDIGNGDRIRTGKDESVEIGFVDLRQNVVKIGSNSDVVIVSGQDPYLIDILSGETMALLANLPEGSSFQIKTPTGLSGARGTGWRAFTDGISSSVFEAYLNAIYVQGIDASGNPMDEIVLDSGYKTFVDKFMAPGRLERLTAQDYDRWNTWREEVNNRAMQRSAYGASGSSGGTGSGTQGMLDKVGQEEMNAIERLEARKQDISESRDVERIADRMEEKVSQTTESSHTGGGHYIVSE